MELLVAHLQEGKYPGEQSPTNNIGGDVRRHAHRIWIARRRWFRSQTDHRRQRQQRAAGRGTQGT